MDALVTFKVRYADHTPVMGVLRIYSSTTILEQVPVPITGDATVLLTEGEQYNVSFMTLSPVYAEAFSLVAEAGATYTISVIPESVIVPQGKCAVRGRVVTPLGEPTRRLRLTWSLISGGVTSGDDVILNDSVQMRIDDDGYVSATLYRNSKYRVTFSGADEYAAFDSFEFYVPNRAYARLADLLYPRARDVELGSDIAGEGDYQISVIMSDGRELTTYTDVIQSIQVGVTGDVAAEIVSVDSLAYIRLSGAMSAWSVLVYGRPQHFKAGPDVWGTASVTDTQPFKTITS